MMMLWRLMRGCRIRRRKEAHPRPSSSSMARATSSSASWTWPPMRSSPSVPSRPDHLSAALPFLWTMEGGGRGRGERAERRECAHQHALCQDMASLPHKVGQRLWKQLDRAVSNGPEETRSSWEVAKGVKKGPGIKKRDAWTPTCLHSLLFLACAAFLVFCTAFLLAQPSVSCFL